MDKLVTALGPAFAAGLAIQQLLELLDPVVGEKLGNSKKIVLNLVALGIGLVLAFAGGLQVLEPLGIHHSTVDSIVTGLTIAGGTQGINSLLKFLGYAKEGMKSEAVKKAEPAKQQAMAAGKAVYSRFFRVIKDPSRL